MSYYSFAPDKCTQFACDISETWRTFNVFVGNSMYARCPLWNFSIRVDKRAKYFVCKFVISEFDRAYLDNPVTLPGIEAGRFSIY